jgi:hypothetical protein
MILKYILKPWFINSNPLRERRLSSFKVELSIFSILQFIPPIHFVFVSYLEINRVIMEEITGLYMRERLEQMLQ